jgi:uncharacterized protein (DUF1697 family)
MQYIAFLRGINVGKRRVKMEQLCKLFSELKREQVRWYIASGNILFVSRRNPSNLESIIESRLEEGLGYPADTFVRTRQELKEICAFDSLPEPNTAGASIQFGISKQTLGVQVQRQLRAASTASDQVMVAAR